MIIIRGVPASPYTRKMLGVLRYRRIPYRYIQGGHDAVTGLPKPKVDLLPVLYFAGDNGELTAEVDSTFIIRRLENEYSGNSVIPENAALGFLDYLLEDYADEWLTKAMFHYRWHFDADAKMASEILPYSKDLTASDEEIATQTADFRDRQVNRLYVVGSNDVTAPVIEQSYQRILTCLSELIKQYPFIMGKRPGTADFAFFGQLTQLAQFDPTSSSLTIREAPRVYAWVSAMEDLTGMQSEQSDWRSVDDARSRLKPLFEEMGRSYVPVMLANYAAAQAGESTVETTVEGLPWKQTTFKYQAYCVNWLREAYNELEPEHRSAVDSVLKGTGCEALFTS